MSTAAEEDPALTARKKTTRAEVKAALKALTSEEMASQSAAIATHLLAQLSCFEPDAARTRSATDRPLRLGLYVHCARLREVDTSALLVAALALPRAEVYVPVVDMPDPAAARAPPSMRFLQITSLEADLEPKTMGILEPTESLPDGAPRPNLETHATDGPLDVLLMPGLAFERTGARLGRGGGFYDAFLERYKRKCEDAGWQTPPAVALAFDVQILEEGKVPVGSSDRNVDALVTARHGVLVCTPAGARAAKPGK
jgi:5-formyltetrahydrofolate cyclo-ligase